MKRIHCEVRGKVQSCGFRNFCWKCARKARVTGWAANDSGDRSRVVVEIQGEEDDLDSFVKLLLAGDGRCRIDSLDQTEIAVDPEEKAFKARYWMRG